MDHHEYVIANQPQILILKPYQSERHAVEVKYIIVKNSEYKIYEHLEIGTSVHGLYALHILSSSERVPR